MEVIISENSTIINVDGLKFSRDIFKHFADDANIGRMFKFVKVENNLVTVESLPISLEELRERIKNLNDQLQKIESLINNNFR